MALEFFKNSQLKKYVLRNKQKLILPKVPGGEKARNRSAWNTRRDEQGIGGWGRLKRLELGSCQGPPLAGFNGHFVQKQFYYPKVFSKVSSGWEEIL